MRQLIVIVTTPDGEVIDRQEVEVSWRAQAISLEPIESLATYNGVAPTLEIIGLAASEL